MMTSDEERENVDMLEDEYETDIESEWELIGEKTERAGENNFPLQNGSYVTRRPPTCGIPTAGSAQSCARQGSLEGSARQVIVKRYTAGQLGKAGGVGESRHQIYRCFSFGFGEWRRNSSRLVRAKGEPERHTGTGGSRAEPSQTSPPRCHYRLGRPDYHLLCAEAQSQKESRGRILRLRGSGARV